METQGHMNFILDNLIDEDQAVPMIVVTENDYATRAGATPQTPASGRGDRVAFDNNVRLLYLHSGTVALDEGIHRKAEARYKNLQQTGIKKVISRDATGVAHEWQTWWYALYDFAPSVVSAREVSLGQPDLDSVATEP